MRVISSIEKERKDGKVQKGTADIEIGIYKGTYNGEVNKKGEAHGYGLFRSNNCGDNVFKGFFIRNVG